MSVESEEKDRKFLEWKREVEKRCAEHLKDHPEEKPRVPASKGFVMPNLLVMVGQDPLNRDVWRVLVNGDIAFEANGPFAQRDAIRYAMRAAETPREGFIGNDQAPSLPPMCIFCGNRYSHRTDCPDSRKTGPDLTGQAGV